MGTAHKELHKLVDVDSFRKLERELIDSTKYEYANILNSFDNLTENIIQGIHNQPLTQASSKPHRRSRKSIVVVKTGVRRSARLTKKVNGLNLIRNPSIRNSMIGSGDSNKSKELPGLKEADCTIITRNISSSLQCAPISVTLNEKKKGRKDTNKVIKENKENNNAVQCTSNQTLDRSENVLNNEVKSSIDSIDQLVGGFKEITGDNCRMSRRRLSKSSNQSIATLLGSEGSFPVIGDHVANSTPLDLSPSVANTMRTITIKNIQPRLSDNNNNNNNNNNYQHNNNTVIKNSAIADKTLGAPVWVNESKISKPLAINVPFKNVNKREFKEVEIQKRDIAKRLCTTKNRFQDEKENIMVPPKLKFENHPVGGTTVIPVKRSKQYTLIKPQNSRIPKKTNIATAVKSKPVNPACEMVYNPSDNYGIEDVTENDDIFKSEKSVPSWAESSNVLTSVTIQQYINPEVVRNLFHNSADKRPDVTELFPTRQEQRARRSTAVWNTHTHFS